MQQAVPNRQNPVRGLGNLLIVSREEDGDAKGSLDLVKQLDHLFAVGLVERSGSLVTEQNIRALNDRPGDGDPLLLPARQLGREFF